ncbi:MAG: hypothetical protein ACREP9_01455, partial [Candidatus Dormibacteraceae bacterium]
DEALKCRYCAEWLIPRSAVDDRTRAPEREDPHALQLPSPSPEREKHQQSLNAVVSRWVQKWKQRPTTTWWIGFHSGVLLVGGLFLTVVGIVMIIGHEQGSLRFVGVIFMMIGLGQTCLALGLRRRRLWAWKGNWVLIALAWLSALRDANEPGLKFMVVGLGWVLPTGLYFFRRRALFASAPERAEPR